MKIIKINSFAGYLLAIAAVACTREAPEANPSLGQIKEITITASYGDPETRTERAADGAVLWSPGDEISLFYGSGTNGGSRFVGQNTEPSKVVNFTGKIGVITGGNDVAVEDTYFWAVYPYNPTASCDGSDDLFPSVGRSQGLVMGFYNICGGLKFTVSEEGIKSVTLRGHNNEILAGTITVGFDGSGLPVINNIADGSEIITVSAPDGETFLVGHSYYLIFVPTVFENGFTLTFSKGYSQAVYDRTKKTTIRRSAFGGLTTPDKDLEWELLYVPIPDANYKAYMIQNFDTNGNGELDYDEAEKVTSIRVITDNIESLAGIEYCANLQRLICTGTNPTLNNGLGKLTSLDLRNNSSLTYLDCRQNEITTLEISHNYLLQRLYCDDNQLTSLDLSSNTDLVSLSCGKNRIASLNVSSNTALTSLTCYSNQMTSLDVSANSSLISLDCYGNQLTSLDVSSNTSLNYLGCWFNKLSSLDVSSNINLIELRCDDNQLNSLDVSANTVLVKLRCEFNRLLSLVTRENTALTYLDCGYNQLTSLDVSSNTALTSLRCYNNQLTSLDVGANTELSELSCNNNQLTSLNVSSNTALTSLYCSNNQLASLDISSNTALTYLDCSNNQLTSLDVGANTALTQLSCNQNSLASINVSNNGALEKMYCSTNLFTSLDVSENLCLKELKCNNNPNLLEIWITTEQPLTVFVYDTVIAIVKYKGEPIIRSISTPDEFLSWVATFEDTPSLYGQEWTVEADIDCGGAKISPIPSFSAKLDGKNHKIYNYIVESSEASSGLFLVVSGTIKNIILGSMDGRNWDGSSTVGYASAEANSGHTGGVCASLKGTIENVKNFAKVVAPMNNALGVSGIGGLVGTMDSPSKITGCENGAVIELSGTMSYGAYAGGIVGHANNAEAVVENCVNSADLEFSLENNKYMMYGGIVGCCHLGALIDKCQNLGAVTLNQSGTETAGTYMMIAGIAGALYTGAMCTNCVNKGAVTSNRLQVSRIGGIVGTLNSKGLIEGNTNDGKVTLKQAVANSNWQAAGGICGFQEKESSGNIIRKNTNNADVIVEVENTTSHNNKVSAGGIIGHGVLGLEISENVNNGSVSIVNKAAGAAYAGGIVGWFKGAGSFTRGNENKGAVSCKTSDDAASMAGGVVGNSSDAANTCTSDKNTGAVTCANTGYAGSIAGTNAGTLTNCIAGGSVNDTALSDSNLASLTQGSSSSGTAEGTTLAY